MRTVKAVIMVLILSTGCLYPATQLKKTVKPAGQGGDYTTLEACLNANEQNLVAADKYFDVEIDGNWSGVIDTTPVVIHNYTTDAVHYINIYTTSSARHLNAWSTDYYILQVTAWYEAQTMTISSNYVRVAGLQIKRIVNVGNYGNLGALVQGGGNNKIISNNLLWTSDSYGNSLACFSPRLDDLYYNNIAYDQHGTHKGAYCDAGVTAYLYNNTFYNFSRATDTPLGGMVIRNNIAQAGGATAYNDKRGTYDSNISKTGDASGNIQATLTFVDTANKNFHLAVSDAAAIGAGYNLASAFTGDIDGETRDANWDIGADEIVLPKVTAVNPAAGINTALTTISVTGIGFLGGTGISSIKLVNGPTAAEYSLSGYTVIDNLVVINAIVPTGSIAGTYDVKVATSLGNSTEAVKFIVTGNAPVVDTIDLNSALNTAVTTVTITGNYFFGGTPSASDILSVRFDDPQSTSLTISSAAISDGIISGAVVPDKIAAGNYNVIVTTHAGSNITSAGKFAVSATVSPTVTTINPNWAGSTGNTSITITGTNFFGGTLTSDIRSIQLSDGFIITYAGAVVSDTEIKGAVVPLGATAGTYDVRVTTGGGTNTTSTGKFEIKSGPKVTGLNPNIGSNLANTTITITGLGYFGAVSSADVSSIKLSDTAATSLTYTLSGVVSDDTIQTVIVPSGVKPGTYDVRVTTGLGSNMTSTQTFAVTTLAPLVANLTPAEGFNNQLTTISISGNRFFGGMTGNPNVFSIKLSDGTTNIDFSTAVITDTSINPCVVPASVTAGTYDIQVTTGGSNNLTSTVRYRVKSSFAVVSTISPGTASNGAATMISITGQNFFGGVGSSVVQNIKLNDPHAVTISAYSVANDTLITGAAIPPGITAGSWDVQIQSSEGTNSTSAQKFIVTALAPTLTSVAALTIANAGNTALTISGTRFFGGTENWIYEGTDVRGVTIYGPLLNGPAITGLTFTCTSDSIINAVVPHGLIPGRYDVRVTTGGGAVTSAVPIRIVTAPPVVSNVTPGNSLNTGNSTITVTGSNFFGGIGTDSVGAIVLNNSYTTTSITKLTVISDTELVGVVPSGAGTGEFDLIVNTTSGQGNTSSAVKYFSLIDSALSNIISSYTGMTMNIPANSLSSNCAILVRDKSADTAVASSNKLKYKNIKCPAALEDTVKEITLSNNAAILTGKSVTLTLNYTPAVDDSIVEKDYRILYLGADNKWAFVDGSQQNDTGLNSVSASLTHLSIFRVGQYIVQAADLSKVVVYPNPVDFSTAAGKTVKFMNLTYNPTLRVFTVSGEPVKELTPDSSGNLGNDGRIEWDGNNDSGSLITRGLYIYTITDEAGNRKVGKFVVR